MGEDDTQPERKCKRAGSRRKPPAIGSGRTLVVRASKRSGGVPGPQIKAVRKRGWTTARRARFLTALAQTCNVTEAVRVAGKDLASAYYLKKVDPGFARAWGEALSIGYDELETLMLRESLFGSEQEEVTLDGDCAVKGRKIRRGHPHTIGIRLLTSHRKEALAARGEMMRDRADGGEARAQLHAALEQVRARRRDADAAEPDDGGGPDR